MNRVGTKYVDGWMYDRLTLVATWHLRFEKVIWVFSLKGPLETGGGWARGNYDIIFERACFAFVKHKKP